MQEGVAKFPLCISRISCRLAGRRRRELATGMVTGASLTVESNPQPGVPNDEGYNVSVDFQGTLNPQLQSLLHVSSSFTGVLSEYTGFQDNFLAPDGHGCGTCIDLASLQLATAPEPASGLPFATILAIILYRVGIKVRQNRHQRDD